MLLAMVLVFIGLNNLPGTTVGATVGFLIGGPLLALFLGLLGFTLDV